MAGPPVINQAPKPDKDNTMQYSLSCYQAARRLAWMIRAASLIAVLAVPALADARKTYFTGVEQIAGSEPPIAIPAGSNFHVLMTQYAVETASDPRVMGQSTIVANAIFEMPLMTGPMWGTYRLVNSGGEWSGYWHGSRTSTPGGVVSSIVATAVGKGAYEGLIGRWDLSGLNVGETNPFLYYTGYIVEASKGHVELPMRWRATRTETMNMATLEFDIDTETGQGTHIGKGTNDGVGFLIPPSGPVASITGFGTLTAADGDKLYWVVEASADLAGQSGTAASVYFAGGTGKFEYAVGLASGTIIASFGPPDANQISRATFDYSLQGKIRY